MAQESIIGLVDSGFDAVLANGASPPTVLTAAPQSDGRILVGGAFLTVNNQDRPYLARLLADGSVEASDRFRARANGLVRCFAVQPDGKILAGGDFTMMNGTPAGGIARLNGDGSLESAATFNVGTGISGTGVVAIAVQPDGKIIIGGEFSTVNGQPRNNLARLLPDGTLESTATFDTGTGPVNAVTSVAVQSDGKILIAGGFKFVNGQTRNHIARLLPNGNLESTTSFNPGTAANTTIRCLALQEDGRILAGGHFTQFNGQTRNRIVRLAASGAMEATSAFNPGTGFGGLSLGTSPAVLSISVQTNGEIIAGGDFNTVNGADRQGLARLSSTGALLTGTGNSLEGLVHSVALQRDGKILVGGEFATINGTSKTSLARLWNADAVQTLVASSPALVQWNRSGAASSLRSVMFDLSRDGEAWTSAGSGVKFAGGWQRSGLSLSGAGVMRARGLATAGQGNGSEVIHEQTAFYNTASPDPSFNPGVTDGSLSAMAVQPDRKILLGGRFGTVGGQPFNRTARISRDGTPDTTAAWNPGPGPNSDVYCMGVQTDGRILVGGDFDVWSHRSRLSIIRLLPNGTVESTTTFNPATNLVFPCYSLGLQPDGKILMAGGSPGLTQGQTQRGLVRLNPNGSADTAGFTPPQLDGWATSVAVQPDGRIVIGGTFTTVNGQPRRQIARLTAGGAVEPTTSFNAGTGADAGVYCVAVQPDGKILVAGNFRFINGQPRNYVARLNADGTLESTATFNPGSGPDSAVESVVLQADGKILLGGSFKQVDGQPFTRIVRLLPNGSVDSPASFNPGSGISGSTMIALESDGGILIGGEFRTVNGTARNQMARLPNGPAVNSLTAPARQRVLWTRGGTAPEVEQVTFELSTNGGANWSPLGAGVRIAGGWERGGLNLPVNGQLRARGRTTGGYASGSTGLVETVEPFVFFPEITVYDGGGVTAPEIISMQPAAIDFGVTRQPTTAVRRFTTANTGMAPMRVSSITAPPGYTLLNAPAMPVNVDMGGAVTFDVRLNATAVGIFPGNVTIASNDPDEAVFSIPVTGTVVSPEITVHDGNADAPELSAGQVVPVDFGTVRQSFPQARVVTVRNTGTAPLLIGSITAPPGYTALDLPTLPRSVAVSQSLVFRLQIDAAAPGNFPGRVRIESDDLDESVFDFPVTATVVSPEIAVHDGGRAAPELTDGQTAAIDFGTARQAMPTARPITVVNTGTAPLLIAGITTPAGYTVLQLPPLPVTIGVNESLTLQIRLDATALGTFAGTITIASDDLDEAAFDFPVTGTVVSPEITVHDGSRVAPELTDGQATAIDFGIARQATPTARPITVVNTGTAPLLISSVTTPAGYTVLQLPPLPVTIGVNESLPLQIRLDATALGTFAGTITIASDDLDEAVFDFPVTGTVVSPEIAVHGGTLTDPELSDGQAGVVDFGRNIQGTPGTRSFTISNTGSAELLVSHLTVPPGFATLNVPVLPLTVGLNRSVTIQISLTTMTVGTHAGSVSITSDDLDEALFDFPISGQVFIPDPVGSVVSTTTTLNRQTGLREQTIRVTNDTTATVPAYNLIIRGLPAGVEVNNASETRADGSVVVYIRQGMAPRSTQDIVLEYYSPNRTPAEINPQLSTEVVLNPPDLTVPAGGTGLVVEKMTRLPGGGMLLEFTTEPGRRYQVQYSLNGRTWQASLPAVRAVSNRTQWIDRGLPRTESHPLQSGIRFYRVALTP